MIPAGLSEWAQRWNIPYGAMAELAQLHNLQPAAKVAPYGADEAWAQSKVRLDAARAGHWLGRNNVGAGKVNGKGFMRWGLANDSEQVNEVCKSADLIGIRHVTITQEMVGTFIGQFWSLEVKRPGWTYTGQGREPAQANWATLVTAHGGRAGFTTGELL